MRTLPLVIPPGQRFSCHRCGACCRGLTVDLDPGEAERIARYPWAREGGRLAGPVFVEGTDRHGHPSVQLAREPDGSCLFLDPADGLCLVHKRLGEAAKPRVCRKFPFVFVAAPDGERAVVSIECASRWRSLADGAPLEGERARLDALRKASTPNPVRWRVQTHAGGRFLDPAAYLALERRLREAALGSTATAATANTGGVSGGGPSLLDRLVRLAAIAREAARAPVEDAALGAALDRGLARLAAPLAEAARVEGHEVVARAAPGLCEARGWRAALARVDADPAARALAEAALVASIDKALPARAPSFAAGVGESLAAVALAALAAASSTRSAPAASATPSDRALPAAPVASPSPASWTVAGPLAADLNLGFRAASLFFRGRAGDRLRATGASTAWVVGLDEPPGDPPGAG